METSVRTASGLAHRSAALRRPAPERRRPNKVDRLEDLLPEHVQYRDDGCEVSPSCLTCPLPVCRYEVRGGLAALQRGPRDAELLDAHRKGAAIDSLCRQFHVSRRTVFRILAAARQAEAKASG
jgi:DNA-binding IclR family transcriptional regulator